MLVISRKQGESIKVAGDIEITVISVDGQRVRLGVKAPRNIRVLRAELDPSQEKSNQDAIAQANQTAVLQLKASDTELLKKAAQRAIQSKLKKVHEGEPPPTSQASGSST